MSALLPQLLKAGLIEKLDGDDQRYEKMAKAAESLVQEFREKPALLIRAVLAGLDPDIPVTDPLIQQAKAALQEQWMTFATAYPDDPVNLFRALLLEACHQCGEGRNAVVLWGTAADTVPMLRLGKGEAVVAPWLRQMALAAEGVCFADTQPTSTASITASETEKFPNSLSNREVDRDDLLNRIAASSGQNYRGRGLENANPYFSNHQNWAWDFTDRMTPLLADELDALAEDVAESHGELIQQIASHIKIQQQQISDLLTAHESHRRTEQLRLDALWWSQALYSPSLNQSYRDLPPAIASVLMATDLIDLATLPTPASVGHLLAETVNHLPEAGYTAKRPLSEWLTELRGLRSNLPENWGGKLIAPPAAGRLSLRDVLVLTLGDKEWHVAACLNRAGIPEDYTISLPALAHALFRQEQAVRLAELEA